MNAAAASAQPRVQPIELDGRRLSIQSVLDIAARRRPIRLSKAALKKVQLSADFLAKELQRGEPIYGVTTGFGSNADRLLENSRRRARPGDELPIVAELQRNLIISHAVCVGQPLPLDLVRAMLAIRINTLLQGHSGVRVVTLERLRDLLKLDLIPVVPEKGSVGASGDLAPLSHLALAVIGEGEVFENGVRVPAAEALARAGLEPLVLSFKEGLALTNGTGQMLASAILAIGRLQDLTKQADINAALALEAFCGRSAAFDERYSLPAASHRCEGVGSMHARHRASYASAAPTRTTAPSSGTSRCDRLAGSPQHAHTAAHLVTSSAMAIRWGTGSKGRPR